MRSDPVEIMVEEALIVAGIRYGSSAARLDFYLPDFDVHIECKRFHTARVLEQMARTENVIVIQGIGAARAFVGMLNRP